VLPKSFKGSQRHHYDALQNALQIVRACGKPHLFVTFTANPDWPEIEQLCGIHKPKNRPDIISRVFEHYKQKLINEIQKDEIFGKTKAVISSVEWQKRGLHCHLLVILEERSKVYHRLR